MSTITRERIAGIAGGEKCYTHDDVVELARIALASLEADSKLSDFVASQESLGVEFEGVLTENIEELYVPSKSTPPAPVSVPLAIHDEDFEKALSVLNDTLDDCGDSERGLLLALDKVGIEVRSDARHAAMLQGADGNSPVIPDGWLACSERMPEEGDDMIVFTDEIVMSGVSYSKKKGFYLQALENDDDEPVDNVTHWMPLPAAPQQETKNV